MIKLHKLRGENFWLNHRQIETIESTPDTVICLSNEHRFLVKESPQEICKYILEFERQVLPKVKPS